MPVFFQDRVTTADLVSNPRVIYAYGDNVARRGRGGMAKVCRGYPNTVGVVTKWAPSKVERAYFTDSQFDEVFAHMAEDLKKLEMVLAYGGTVVFPTAPLGSGRAELPTRAPRLYGALRHCVAALAEIYGGAPCPW